MLWNITYHVKYDVILSIKGYGYRDIVYEIVLDSCWFVMEWCKLAAVNTTFWILEPCGACLMA